MSKVKIKLNSAGVRAVLKSEGMMSILEGEANRRASQLGSGYGVSTYVGRNRCNAEIRAETYEAKRDNLKHNTLLRALS